MNLPHRSLDEWLSHIESVHFRSIDLSLDRPRRVFHQLGLSRPAVAITVGGTNGKGTTVAMLEAVYRDAGYRVGSYTSPHLISYRERVRIDGTDIEEGQLIEAFEAVERARGSIPITYFEFGTLAAFFLFAQAALDVVLLEVGMGGRLDAVNLISPDLAILTTVGLDHQAWLGTTREKIGREKAGIFRYRGKVVVADRDPPKSVLERIGQLRCEAQFSGREYIISPDLKDGWRWALVTGRRPGGDLPREVLLGACSNTRADNAGGALAGIYALHPMLPVASKSLEALNLVTVPGRRQRLRGAASVWFDVGHNPQAIQALADELGQETVSGRTRAVFSMLGDKDIEGSVDLIKDHVDEWYLAEVQEARGIPMTMLRERLRALPLADTMGLTKPVDVFYHALSKTRPGDRLVVFGSFYLVGDILATHPEKVIH